MIKRSKKLLGVILFSGIMATSYTTGVFAEDNTTVTNLNNSINTATTTGAAVAIQDQVIGTQVKDEYDNVYEVTQKKEEGVYTVELISVNHPMPYCDISVQFEKNNIKYELSNYEGTPWGSGAIGVFKCYNGHECTGYDIVHLANLDEQYSENFYLNMGGIVRNEFELINENGKSQFYSVASYNGHQIGHYIFEEFIKESYPDYNWTESDGIYTLVNKNNNLVTTNDDDDDDDDYTSTSSSSSSSSSSSDSESSSNTEENKVEVTNNNDKIIKSLGGNIIGSSTTKGLNGSDLTITEINKADGTKSKIINTSTINDKIQLSNENGAKVYKFIEELGLYMPVAGENSQDGTVVSLDANSTYCVVDSIMTDGVAKEGWNKINNSWMMLDENGGIAKGWHKDTTGLWYMLGDEGKMKTGWYKDNDGSWYLLGSNGAMKTGWAKDSDGKWYYMNEHGVMLHDTYVDKYYIGSNGAWVQ